MPARPSSMEIGLERARLGFVWRVVGLRQALVGFIAPVAAPARDPVPASQYGI